MGVIVETCGIWRGVGVKLLCLSNGHGEDIVAVRILRSLQEQPAAPEIAALPLVGLGQAYTKLDNVPIVGPVQAMPSGGFVYMDGQQLWQDLRSGLVRLTWEQFKVIRDRSLRGWTILAVGDILPLLLAWLSGADYAFVGTSRSEYYIRDESGLLERRSWRERFESFWGSVYLPWERALLRSRRCKAVFVRDELTAQKLEEFSISALNPGNPMMDDLDVQNPAPLFDRPDAELEEMQRRLVVVLLPGSRTPEAYANWQKIIGAIAGLVESYREKSPVFLGAIAPGLSLEPLRETLQEYGWQANSRIDATADANADANTFGLRDPGAIAFTFGSATLILSQKSFVQCLQKADLAIAMAGTATEQFVGLGKPAIAIPGKGPQFTPAFAEAQSRLLGPSLILAQRPRDIPAIVGQLFGDPDRLQLIAENGDRRMGKPGASNRIAACLIERLE